VVAKQRNQVEKGFLQTYRRGRAREVRYLPLSRGFLKLEYASREEQGMLFLVSFVLDEDDRAMAVGPRLELRLDDTEEGGAATLIEENAVSGLQWSNGAVLWGHTYEDDGPPEKGRAVSLGTWIDDCIETMINPSDEAIAERRRIDRE
jgi:hypothetical protein